jgi:hypothetical protein
MYGPQIHPTNGHFLPILIGGHLGMIIDIQVRHFGAPTTKMKSIAVITKVFLC